MKIDAKTGKASISPEEAAGFRAGSRLAEFREQMPEAIGALARIVADNPREVALTVAGIMVMDKILLNLVKPRTPIEALAAVMIAPALNIYLLNKAVDGGLIDFRFPGPPGTGTTVRLSEMRRELREHRAAGKV